MVNCRGVDLAKKFPASHVPIIALSGGVETNLKRAESAAPKVVEVVVASTTLEKSSTTPLKVKPKMSLQIPHRDKTNGAQAATKAVILVSCAGDYVGRSVC
jgi:hypothetical protein